MGSRKGFTIATESTIKVVGVVLIGALFFAMASDQMIPLIDSLAESLGFSPYEEAAINSAKATTYAVSCTALIQSYAECSAPGDDPACEDVHSAWQSAASPDITKSCDAAGGGSTKFGNIEVTCDELGAGDDGTCEVRNFNFPQNFQEGDGSIADKAATFLLGRGHPKYLLYYEAYAPSQASDWQSRLAGTDLIWRSAYIVGFAVMNGMLTALPTFGLAAGPVSGKAKLLRQMLPSNAAGALKGALDDVVDIVSSGLGQRFPDSITNRLSSASSTADDIIDGIFGTAHSTRGWLHTKEQIIRRYTRATSAQLRNLPQQVGMASSARITMEGADRQTVRETVYRAVNGAGETDGLLVAINPRSYIDDAGNVDVPGLTTEVFNQLDDIAMELPESNAFRTWWTNNRGGAADSLANAFAQSLGYTARGADQFLQRANTDALNIGERWVMKTSALASRGGAVMRRAAQVGSNSRITRFARPKISKGWDVVRSVPSSLRERLFLRSEGVICASNPLQVAVASSAIQDIVETQTTQQAVEERFFASAIEPISFGTSQMLTAIRSACGSGRSPFAAIAALGSTTLATGALAMTIGIQAEYNEGVSRAAQGINTLNLKRPWFSPETYELNRWANIWFLGLEPYPGGHGFTTDLAGSISTKRRFMVASPCQTDYGEDNYLQVERNSMNVKLPAVKTIDSNDEDNWGRSNYEGKHWFERARGSYSAVDTRLDIDIDTDALSDHDVIAYTAKPIMLYKVPDGDEDHSYFYPYGQTGHESQTFIEQPESPQTEDEPYLFNQTMWVDSGGTLIRQDVYLSPEANGVRALSHTTAGNDALDTILSGLNPFDSQALQYDLDMLQVTFEGAHNDLGNLDKAGYCYARMDLDAAAAKGAIIVLSLSLDIIADSAYLTGVGSGVAFAAGFAIGFVEEIAWFAVEETMGQGWPY